MSWKPIETMPEDVDVLLRSAKNDYYDYDYAVGSKTFTWGLTPSGVYATYDGCGGVELSFNPVEWKEIE